MLALYLLCISDPSNLLYSFRPSSYNCYDRYNKRRNEQTTTVLDEGINSKRRTKENSQFVIHSTKAYNPQSFNPFSSRMRNTNVKWFETDLDSFYTFVEEQPLLTAAQEVQYGKALKTYLEVEKIRNKLWEESTGETGMEIPSGRLSDEELALAVGCTVETLQKMAKYAEISKSRLVNSNLKLVLAIVSRYRTSNIPNSELIAEGTRGLARAVLRFDYSKGFRFATYATWYVHQAVSEYVRWRKHPAKMPSRYLLLLRRVKQFTTEYKAEFGKMPSLATMSTELGQSHFDVRKVLSMQQYPSLLNAAIKTKKPEAVSADGRERTLEDVLPSLYQAPNARTDYNDLRHEMEKMLKMNLNDVERDILRLRLGLDDGRVKPVKEVGRKFKISWKQVRSVEKEALSKLLDSTEINEFVDSYHNI